MHDREVGGLGDEPQGGPLGGVEVGGRLPEGGRAAALRGVLGVLVSAEHARQVAEAPLAAGRALEGEPHLLVGVLVELEVEPLARDVAPARDAPPPEHHHHLPVLDPVDDPADLRALYPGYGGVVADGTAGLEGRVAPPPLRALEDDEGPLADHVSGLDDLQRPPRVPAADALLEREPLDLLAEALAVGLELDVEEVAEVLEVVLAREPGGRGVVRHSSPRSRPFIRDRPPSRVGARRG